MLIFRPVFEMMERERVLYPARCHPIRDMTKKWHNRQAMPLLCYVERDSYFSSTTSIILPSVSNDTVFTSVSCRQNRKPARRAMRAW